MIAQQTKKFSIATKTEYIDGSVRWECKSSTYDEALYVLVQNGWTKEQADLELAACPEHWILVNNCTQIC
jgi:hypothetical protein